ncbi:hypothetical protein FB451DRAFT_1173490 [Mycena latifolia]|nr:hypothetical protein FB451DRAFT_1173490 [Mycena latifolia]
MTEDPGRCLNSEKVQRPRQIDADEPTGCLIQHGEKKTKEEKEEQRCNGCREEEIQILAKITAGARERESKSRTKIRAAKIEARWVPVYAGRKQLTEDSCPQQEFKEDTKKRNKPSERKQKPENVKTDAKQVNWVNPLLERRSRSWRSKQGSHGQLRSTVEAKHLAPQALEQLSSQAVYCWIDHEAKVMGVSKWKDSILEWVKSRAASGGQSTPAGILMGVEEGQVHKESRATGRRQDEERIGIDGVDGASAGILGIW